MVALRTLRVIFLSNAFEAPVAVGIAYLLAVVITCGIHRWIHLATVFVFLYLTLLKQLS